jgi:hypothetical protein
VENGHFRCCAQPVAINENSTGYSYNLTDVQQAMSAFSQRQVVVLSKTKLAA